MHQKRVELREEIAAIDDVDKLREIAIQSTEMLIAMTMAIESMTGNGNMSISDAQLMLELASEYDLDAEVRIS